MAQIIKGNGTVSSGQEIRPQAFNFDDMSSQAQGYLASVQKKAAGIIQQAHIEAEQIRKKAAQEGQQQAVQLVEQKMSAQIQQQLQTVLPALRGAVESVQQSKQSWLKHWEDRAVRLAGLIAGRIVRRELERNPEITIELIREALELAAGESDITLLLHPRDHQILKDQIDPLLQTLGGLGRPRVVSDGSISPGGCKIVTQYGEIDQQLETQLDVIEKELIS